MQHVLLKNGNHPGVKLAQGILADAITGCHNGHTLLKFAGPVLGDMYIEPRDDLEKFSLTIINICAAICYAEEFTKRGKFTSQRHLIHVMGKRVIRLGPPRKDPGPRVCRELGQYLMDRCGVLFKNLATAADGMYRTIVENNDIYSQGMEVTINGV